MPSATPTAETTRTATQRMLSPVVYTTGADAWLLY
jgi:hypothetical protein